MARFSAGTLLLGIVAVMFGLLGAYIVRREMHKPKVVTETAPVEAPQTYVVPMASTDLEEGRQITLSDIAIYRMSGDELKKNGINGAFMNRTDQIIGRVLRDPLSKGTSFDTDLFYPEGTGPSVAERLESGQRAITVTVENADAVSGFASPGSIVDVIFRSEADEDDELPETTITLLQGVKVLAYNNQTFQATTPNAGQGNSDSASVTLAVAPQQVSALRVVEGRGVLSLALRNPEDNDLVLDDQPRTLNEVLKRTNNKHKMEIYRGRSLSQVEFDGRGRLTPTPLPAQLATQPTSTDVPPTQGN
ncbi:MAG: pilus assembly protein CpaB [Pirellulaceae bacterium]|jgi:pilus assembly protein CpaB